MYRLFTICFLIFWIFNSCSVENKKAVEKIHLNHFIQDKLAPLFKKAFLEKQSAIPTDNPNVTYVFSSNSGPGQLPVVAKGGDYNMNGNQFRMIVVDMNNNGIFNEQEVDCISVGAFGKDTVSLMGQLRTLTEDNLVIQAGSEKFRVSSVSVDGQSLALEKLEEENISNVAMAFPSQLLPLEAKLLNEQSADIRSLAKGKFAFFEFWYSGCKGCITIIPKINELAEKYADDLLIIGVNSSDDLAYAQKLTEKHDFLGLNQQILGVDSPAIMDYFGKIGVHPRGYLFDKKGNLIYGNVSPYDLEEILASTIGEK